MASGVHDPRHGAGFAPARTSTRAPAREVYDLPNALFDLYVSRLDVSQACR
jgi:hypothetical protein